MKWRNAFKILMALAFLLTVVSLAAHSDVALILAVVAMTVCVVLCAAGKVTKR